MKTIESTSKQFALKVYEYNDHEKSVRVTIYDKDGDILDICMIDDLAETLRHLMH